MTNLHEITGLNKYCGPAVLAALTGKSTDTCASVISSISGKSNITFVDIDHLLRATERLGFVPEEVRPYGRTLFSMLSYLVTRPGFYIILVPKHVVAVEVTSERKIYFIDNHTKHPINAASSARLTQEVQKVWQVKPKPQPKVDEGFRAARISYINGRVDNINITISRLVREREQLITELENLQNDNTTTHTSSV